MKLFLLALLVAPLGFSQQPYVFEHVNASQIKNQSGGLLASGSICFLGTDSGNNPITYTPQNFSAIASAQCGTVTNGVVSNFRVANPTYASPANLNYRVTILNGATTILTIPNVVLANGPQVYWDQFVMPGTVTATGLGIPMVPCLPGAIYTQSDSSYSNPNWSCGSGRVWTPLGTPTPNTSGALVDYVFPSALALQYASNMTGVKFPVNGATPAISVSATSQITNPTVVPFFTGGAIDTTHFNYLGFSPMVANSFGSRNTAITDGTRVYALSNGAMAIEFMADSANVEYYTPGAGQFMRILVDGVPVLETSPLANGGTAQAGAASTITLASAASASNGIYNADYVLITGGTGAGQTRQISGYVGATRVATVFPAWATAPDATSVYQVQLTTSLLNTLPSDGQPKHVLLAFGSRAVRRIHIEAGSVAINVAVDASGTVTKPVPQQAIRAFVIGDSFAEGTGAVNYGNAFPFLLGSMFGWEVWNFGEGGTGIVNNDAGIRFSYQDRILPPSNAWLVNTYGLTANGTMTFTQNGVSTSAIATNANIATLQAAFDAAFGSGAFACVFWTGNVNNVSSSFAVVGKGATATVTSPLTMALSGTTGTAAITQYIGPLASNLPLAPNGTVRPFIIFVEGSGNDDSFAATTLPAAAATFYSQLHSTFPTAVIIASGRWMNQGPAGAAAKATDIVLAAAANANLPTINRQSPFIDLFNNSTGVGYMNGTSNVTAPTGTAGNNTDWLVLNDSTHPAYMAGHYNLALQFAKGIMAIIAK